MKSKKQGAKRRPVLPYRRIFPRLTAAAFACSLCMWMPHPVSAGDIEGANVVQGSATIAAGIDPSITNITASDRAIIEYQQFNISSQNTVNFIQPSATSSVLNRIVGNSPSTLNGTLNANGQVYFVNPAGVYFGPNSVINAGRFHAAAGNITNQDFNAGIMRFTATGALVNDGTITANEGVTLVGQTVTNNGSIVAANGLVSLSSGDTEYIADGDSRVLVKVDSLSANGQSRASESDVDGTGVANNGTIEADEVIFSSGDVYSLAIKNSGTVTADENVTIASGGDVENTGTIEAGNDVKISGDFATLAAGSIHAGNVASIKVNHFQLGGDLSAGKEIYLDPTTLNVVDDNAGVDQITNDQIVGDLNAGTDVTLAADEVITVDAAITTTQNKTATLALNDENGGADLTINLNAPITLKSKQTLTGEGATVSVGANGKVGNGIDVASDGGNVNLAAATYDEDVIVDKPVTLNGANAGISAVDGVRGAESVIDGNMTITSDNVTVDGIELTNFRYNGIFMQALNNVTITNSLFTSPDTGTSAAGAIIIQPVIDQAGTVTVDGVNITNNKFDIPAANSSTTGIRFTMHKTYGGNDYFINYDNVNIADNEFVTPYRSIWSATPTAYFHINNLDITANNFHDSGTALNLGNMDATSSITGNNFENLSSAMVVHFREVGAQISGNQFNNVSGSGIYFFDDTWFPTTSEGASVTGNTFTNVGRHIYSASDLVDTTAMIAENGFDKMVFASSSDNIFGTIQSAVDGATAGDTVTVSDGTYVENVTIDKALSLVSENGYTTTTIQGDGAGSELATIVIGADDVQLGDLGKGFTIIGLNGNGAVEKAAVYLDGAMDNINIIGNDIVANGDYGLLSLYGAAVTNTTIDSNIFSGKTFEGENPGGAGFSEQFNVGNNVPRQLVAFNGGAGSSNDNIVFTSNQITGVAGGLNDSNAEQGNTLVTIDAINSTVTGNTFAGTTARYGAALRVRGAGDATITGNTFDSSNMGVNNAQIYAQMATINGVDSFAGLAAVNTFDRGAYIVGSANGASLNTSIKNTVNGSSDGDTIQVLQGEYDEGKIDVANDGITILGANAGLTPGDATRGEESTLTGSFRVAGDSFTVDGMTILGGVSNGGDVTTIDIVGATSGHLIQNNILTGSNGASDRVIVSGYNAVDFTIINNDISGGVNGMYINPTDGTVTIANNTIHDNVVGVASDGVSNITIRNNFFVNNSLEGIGASNVGTNFIVTENSFDLSASDATIFNHGGTENAILADSNFMGSADPAVFTVEGNVELTNLLVSEVDDAPDTYGFQPTLNASNGVSNDIASNGGTNNTPQPGNNPNGPQGDGGGGVTDNSNVPFSMQMALNENATGSGANANPELAQQLDELFDSFLENQLDAFQLALNDTYSDYMANASADASMDVRMAGFYNVTQQNDKLTTQFKELMVMIESVEKLAKSLGLDEAEARAMLFEKVKPANMSVAEFGALVNAYRSQQ